MVNQTMLFTTDLPNITTTATLSTSSSSDWLLTGIGSTTTTPNLTTNLFSAATTERPPDLIHNDFVQIFFGVLYATVFSLGVFGNVLVCYVVLRNPAMQTVTNIFITNLALSDILLCILAVPFTPLYTFMGRWAFGMTMCHLVSFSQGCSIYISTLTLTSIAIDRYFVIIYPFQPRMKLSTCIGIIIGIWVIAVLATLPYGMYVKVVSDVENATLLGPAANSTDVNLNSSTTIVQQAAYMQAAMTGNESTISTISLATPKRCYCEENWPSEQYRKVFGSITMMLQFVIPFVIISICYICISMRLNARARAKPGSKSSRREEADRDRKKRTNRMLISMVAVFGSSWMPLNLVNIFDDFYVSTNEWRFYTLFFFVAHSIAMSSTCYNPFLYAWLNENFRKEFKHVLPCFYPSNNNIINITRNYNRSDRNTCGPRLQPHGGNGAGGGGENTHTNLDDQDDENGITQETCLPKLEKLLIIPREPTYGNGMSNAVSPILTRGGCGGGGNINAALVHSQQQQVDILLNDREMMRRCMNRTRRDTAENDDDFDSGDEQTVEVRFSETPFVSSDNTTGVSMVEMTTTTTATTTGSSSSPNNPDVPTATGTGNK